MVKKIKQTKEWKIKLLKQEIESNKTSLDRYIKTLVEYGFRLPSALDNRPLRFNEFNKRINQVIYVSATPAEYEMGLSRQSASKVINGTGIP